METPLLVKFTKTALCQPHVRLENGNVLFRAALLQKGMPDKKVHLLGRNESDFITFASIPAADHEAIAQFVETLPNLYLFGHDAYEPFQCHEGLQVYRVWAKRVEEGAGIVLRKPILSKVCPDRIPNDITGHLNRSEVKIKKGELVNYATARQLIKDRIQIPFQITSNNGTIARCHIVSFIERNPGALFIRKQLFSGRGEPRGFAQKKKKISVPTANDTLPFLALEDTECEWGDKIDMIASPSDISAQEAICSLPDDCFAICREKDYFLFGSTESHAIRVFDADYIILTPILSEKTLPTPFTRKNAERVLARLQNFLSESPWKLVPYSEIKADLLGAILAST